jgi:hypothetical protein
MARVRSLLPLVVQRTNGPLYLLQRTNGPLYLATDRRSALRLALPAPQPERR